MGLLKKLAGLVVEFPDQTSEHGAASKGSGEGEEDVVAAIERVRRELETSASPSFDEAKALSKAAGKPGDSSASALPADAAAGGAAPAGEGAIRLPIVLSVDEVYQHAQLPGSADALNVYKVETMMNDSEMADIAMDIRARMVKMTLKTMGRELREVLEDAARRDQALEQYSAYLQQRVDEVSAAVVDANAKLKQEIENFVAAKAALMDGNLAKQRQAQQALAEFARSKQVEEERLFSIVAPFVAPGENPVVVSQPPGAGAKPALKSSLGGSKTTPVGEEPKAQANMPKEGKQK